MLRLCQGDESTEVMSDHIINSSRKLKVYVSLLFTSMLCNVKWNISHTKGRMGKSNNPADNIRAINLSNIFGKLIDVIVTNKENENVCASGLQVSFKPGPLASVCIWYGDLLSIF